MKCSLIVYLTVLVCASSLLLCHVTAAPAYTELAEKDRQDIIQFAAKIIRALVKPDDIGYPDKRNSGMLDAIINMPDLFKAGRK